MVSHNLVSNSNSCQHSNGAALRRCEKYDLALSNCKSACTEYNWCGGLIHSTQITGEGTNFCALVPSSESGGYAFPEGCPQGYTFNGWQMAITSDDVVASPSEPIYGHPHNTIYSCYRKNQGANNLKSYAIFFIFYYQKHSCKSLALSKLLVSLT